MATANQLEAVGAIGTLAIAAGTVLSHFVGQARVKQRTWNRVEDALFGYEGEPGVLSRLATVEAQLRTK